MDSRSQHLLPIAKTSKTSLSEKLCFSLHRDWFLIESSAWHWSFESSYKLLLTSHFKLGKASQSQERPRISVVISTPHSFCSLNLFLYLREH